MLYHSSIDKICNFKWQCAIHNSIFKSINSIEIRTDANKFVNGQLEKGIS